MSPPAIPEGPDGDGGWRANVQRAMLTLAAVVVPSIAIIAIVLRSGGWTWRDDAVMAALGILVPLCRFTRGPLAARAAAMLAIAFAAAFYALGRNGLAGGISAALLALTILAFLGTSRQLGFTFVAITAIAYLSVGFLARDDRLPINFSASDPHLLRNWIRIGATVALLAVLVIGVVEFVVRQVEASSRAANDALKRLRTAYDRLETTKEDERRFLSHELHDELGQTLTALKLSLQLAGRAPARADGAGGPLSESLGMVDDLIARVRKISLDLRPPLLDEVGLVSALRAYLQSQAAVSGVAIALHAGTPDDGATSRLPADYEIACFRVVQESITNVLRHAGASHIDVRVTRRDHHVSLRIEDDGHGFDPATLDDAAVGGHLGVLGMRERIRARAGRFRLTSTPGRGTAIEVELDLPPPA
jgi:signal transduction histidine kinase